MPGSKYSWPIDLYRITTFKPSPPSATLAQKVLLNHIYTVGVDPRGGEEEVVIHVSKSALPVLKGKEEGGTMEAPSDTRTGGTWCSPAREVFVFADKRGLEGWDPEPPVHDGRVVSLVGSMSLETYMRLFHHMEQQYRRIRPHVQLSGLLGRPFSGDPGFIGDTEPQVEVHR